MKIQLSRFKKAKSFFFFTFILILIFFNKIRNFGFSAYEIQTKMSNHNDIIDYLKRQHSVEIENLQYEYNQNFNELKSIYENVKILLGLNNKQFYILGEDLN